MWQRVQTLYFFLAAALSAVLLFGDFARVPGSEDALKYTEYLPYAILAGIAALATLIAAFGWKNRSLQIRLGGGSAVVLLALQVWLVAGYFKLPQEFVVRWTAVLPFVALVLDILAMRGVYADELLVRSSSRLRSSKRKNK